MSIPLPSQIKITPIKDKPYASTVEISPLFPGFGHTVGNSLRRVLLSSLEGAGITSVKIRGAEHEFMSLPHIKEEVLEIILNLKELNLRMHTGEKERLAMKVRGKKIVTAAEFGKNSNIEIINLDQHIATLTHKDADLELEITVEKGLGFSPVEEREKETEVEVISIDTVFSPIKSIGYSVSDVRVGKRTDFDKLTLEIETNGTIDVHGALQKTSQVLVDHFTFMVSELQNAVPALEPESAPAKKSKKAAKA